MFDHSSGGNSDRRLSIRHAYAFRSGTRALCRLAVRRRCVSRSPSRDVGVGRHVSGTVLYSLGEANVWEANRSDALFICYAIDRETGGQHNEKVVQAVRKSLGYFAACLLLTYITPPSFRMM